ncbi:hypothetical protein [Stigmatella aurantiaca]|uniref:Uncharacterized protein n=1 Tax=Stigmatella aurantiaca (strain DW4/3-1) TaxID=378806 RepID=Q08NQ3_STIAD|nr:hypothetical protein [Stigmatella aurantiaca]EAU62113.1 hypothetical protein STIAU_5658 [Stigmatella aurantiaca DW4/3-1]
MLVSAVFRSRGWIGAVALLSLAACGDEDETSTPPPAELVCDAAAYDEAVRDAAEPTQEDVVTGLVAITPTNPKLVWNADKTAVKMVAWTTYRGYTPGDNTLSREVWVTTVPQVQDLCKTLPSEDIVPRLNQYLGLLPATESDNARYFAEMWVKPGDLFRPCPDAEIDDSTCGLEFPASATAEHKNWINANYAYSYGFWQKTHFPWSGLGYTYDWCNADTHVGASEFVIRAGSVVSVTAQIERATYCAP